MSATKTNTLRKEEVTLRKQHCFRRITYSCRRVHKTTASEGPTHRSLKASEDIPLMLSLKTKTSEVYPLTKTVADYSHGTKGIDTRHAGLRKDNDNM
ncbi:hypothetical protein E3N88_31642 [Mikania micrantha]|uniref:Uncharacterized protein n=1 Tax=Mikania micrantha TaxID=192012 RepID=A0A5N6M6Z1_9ASTR|nr:hypothetical protein E3N88_31642 [Mikania micrantha]